MRYRFLLAVITTVVVATGAGAQPVPPIDRPGALKAGDRVPIGDLVLASPEVRRLTGGAAARTYFGDPTPDKAEVEAYLDGRTDRPPRSTVTVLIVAPAGAARATVAVEGRRILSIQPLAPGETPLFDEDVAQALDLVRQDGRARALVGAPWHASRPPALDRNIRPRPMSPSRFPPARPIPPTRAAATAASNSCSARPPATCRRARWST